MPEPVRIGIIGTGLIVTGKQWPALRRLQRDFRVIALANRTPAKAEGLAEVIRKETQRGQPSIPTIGRCSSKKVPTPFPGRCRPC